MTTTLNASALLSVARAKDHLQIQSADTSQDDRVTEYVNAVSDAIEWYADRKFIEQTYTQQLFTGDGSAFLLLRQYPVTVVTAVYIDRTRAFAANSYSSAEFAVHREIGLLRRQRFMWPKWPGGIAITYKAGFVWQENTPAGAQVQLPFDVVKAAQIFLGLMWDMRSNRSAGVGTRGKLGETVSFLDQIPDAVKTLLGPHVRENYLKRRLAEL